MPDSIPDGPTDPRLTAAPAEDSTTLISPPPGAPVGPPVAEPPGRVYTAGESRYRGEPVDEPFEEPTAFAQPPAIDPPAAGAGAGDADPGAGGPGADRGQTTIAEEVVERVIERIVDLTVEQTPGVRELYAAEQARPVSVRLDGDQSEIGISVRMEFGHAVHEVVQQVRGQVIAEAERLLGLTVTRVDVLVADVAFDPLT